MTTAIETEYAGHRFRSRLEARWAVFFDKLGVSWLYEPQGYELGNGERYLPDFWLPDLQVWVEVKGAATDADLVKLFHATAADGLPLLYEVGQQPNTILDGRGLAMLPSLERVLLLGDVPLPSPGAAAWVHPLAVLTSHGPAMQGVFIADRGPLYWIGRPRLWPSSAPEWLSGLPAQHTVQPGLVADAYDAARKARFEHGEFGYLTPALRQPWPGPARSRKAGT